MPFSCLKLASHLGRETSQPQTPKKVLVLGQKNLMTEARSAMAVEVSRYWHIEKKSPVITPKMKTALHQKSQPCD